MKTVAYFILLLFVGLFVNIFLFSISLFTLFAYDEGQLEMNWFVKLCEFLITIYYFPLLLNEQGWGNYWLYVGFNQIIISTILSILVILIISKKSWFKTKNEI